MDVQGGGTEAHLRRAFAGEARDSGSSGYRFSHADSRWGKLPQKKP